jgi:hypothetical protein
MSLILSGTDGLSDVDGTAATPAIRGTDANTGIFFPAADTIAFAEGGVEAARFDSAGNFGIGTSSPSTYGKFVAYSSGGYFSVDANGQVISAQLLDVATAGGRFSGYSNRGDLGAIHIEQATTGADGGYMAFRISASGSTSTTERARIDSSGNLGIGTTSPVGKVDVQQSTTDMVGLSILNTNNSVGTTTSSQVRLGITNSAGVSYAVIKAQEASADDYPALTFGVQNAVTTTPTERARIDSNGSLVVGGTTVVTNNGGITATTTSSGSVAASLAMRNAGTANGSGTTLVFRGVSNASAEHDYAYVAGVADDTTAKTGSIRFSTTAGSSPVERARIDSSGNLLVGATSGGGQRIYAEAANGTNAIISSNNTTNGNASGYSSSLQTGANNTSSYHYYGSTLAVGNWYLYGNGTSSWSSDERLKHNIQTTRDGYIEDVCKLRVVKYQWKNGPQQVELGLIAQEVEQIFPNLVQDDLNQISPDDPILYKQLKGSVLPMILLKAIQEQQTLITQLTARITALETA